MSDPQPKRGACLVCGAISIVHSPLHPFVGGEDDRAAYDAWVRSGEMYKPAATPFKGSTIEGGAITLAIDPKLALPLSKGNLP